MKYLDEYRDGRIARALVSEIAEWCTRPWVLMEICGGQTHTIMRYGLDELLPRKLELVHGPGCPRVRDAAGPARKPVCPLGELPRKYARTRSATSKTSRITSVFDLEPISGDEPAECISAQVLQGLRKPTACSAFAIRCTPDNPLGAPMVSSEEACAAYYRYRRHALAR